MPAKLHIKDIWKGICELFYPALCLGCNRSLRGHEKVLCLSCQMQLPITSYHHQPENQTAILFSGRFRFQAATSFAYFTKDGLLQLLLHELKYKGRKKVGIYMGTLFGYELQQTNWVRTVDCIIPVPLHAKKQQARGFNQSECIAYGLSSVLQLPVLKHHVYRCKNTDSQTRKTRSQRLENMNEAFAIKDAASLEGKHVLLVDDVLTTGATLESCALCLLQVKGLKISIATIGIA